MGKIHISKDTKIQMEDLIRMAVDHDRHVAQWIKMTNMGESWSKVGQIERVIYEGPEPIHNVPISKRPQETRAKWIPEDETFS